MQQVALACGELIPALGQGTWYVGDDPQRHKEEVAAIRRGLDLGLTLVDTAEMYGDGRSEQLVGEAIAGRRSDVFLVSKVYPHRASLREMRGACEASLRRLRVDTLDLYLLHWPGPVPLEETVQAFEALRQAGKIRHWGVSNFDPEGMEALWATPGGRAVQTNQVLYNLERRGIEWDLAPWQREHRIPVMAYSPLEQGRLLRRAPLRRFAQAQGMTPAQVALAWLLAQEGVLAIPRSGTQARVEEAAGALQHPLSRVQLEELDKLFAPPSGPSPLEML
jgi:diketogulonate reductase-like aldo/keto reductase